MQDSDSVFDYSCCALGFCLLARDFNDAMRRGDGGRILRLCKFYLLYFKAAGKTKYAYHTLRLLVQVHCLLTPRVAHQVVWNRFVNLSGKPDTNLALDYFLELCNKIFKLECKAFHGKISIQSVRRISQAAQKLDRILHVSDKAAAMKSKSGKHKKLHPKEDIEALIEQQHAERIFEEQPGRYHKAYPNYPRHLLHNLSFIELQLWMKKKFKDLDGMKLYK